MGKRPRGVFPELEGQAAFDDAAQVLEAIARLPVRWVIPGRGVPFDDVVGALQRARGWPAGAPTLCVIAAMAPGYFSSTT